MAKSLRSKIMRKNRAQLRKTVGDPIIKRRQEAISAAIKKGLEEKQGGSLLGLKNIMSSTGNVPTESKEEMEEDEEDEISKDDEIVFGNKKFSKEHLKKKISAVKSSRPAKNSTKQLVWFK